jgi:hypothetical protein
MFRDPGGIEEPRSGDLEYFGMKFEYFGMKDDCPRTRWQMMLPENSGRRRATEVKTFIFRRSFIRSGCYP